MIKEMKEVAKERTARIDAERKESSNVYDLYESSEELRDAIQKLSVMYGESIGQVMEKLDKACNAFVELGKHIIENVTLYAEAFKNLEEIWCVRPPAEIKKELKHEKNPMRRKQLNRELTESCRWYKELKKKVRNK